MLFERIEKFFSSLRFRISAWNTAAVLLIVIVTLLALREALRFSLLQENDLLLMDDAYEVVLAVEGLYPSLEQIQKEMERKALGHVDRDLFVQLLDANGRLIATRGKPPDLAQVALPTSDKPELLAVRHYRMVQRVITKAGIPHFMVRVGASTTMVTNDIATLTRLMAGASVVILFVAPLSGYFLAGRATRPLARILATAARLGPRHMEERLPIRGTQDELDQLSHTINRFLDLLRDYLDRNREFVANAAHELRSPLAAIQSSVEVTLNSDRSVEEYQDMLGEVADQCGHLRILVNQLLLLAETDAARFPMEASSVRFDLVVRKSVEMFAGVAEEQGVELSTDVIETLTTEGDGGRLRQVVSNLIDNGLKFTPRGGQIRVTLRRHPTERQIVLTVADTGVGINSEDVPHVFDRFYRGDKSRQRQDFAHGNGLGLSICQSIVLAHGGTIAVQSALGRGTTFTVCLPWFIEGAPESLETPGLSQAH
jgi:signal transduction histidine kinase